MLLVEASLKAFQRFEKILICTFSECVWYKSDVKPGNPFQTHTVSSVLELFNIDPYENMGLMSAS